MKKKDLKYRLQPLLDQKKRLRRAAEIKLAKAISQLEREKKNLEKKKEEKKKIIEKRKNCRLELHQKMAAGDAHVRDGSMRINYLKKLEEDQKKKEKEIEEQKELIEQCKDQVKRARRHYIDAVKDLRVMEKHKDLWKKRVDLELSKQEERKMDELGNIIYERRSNLQRGLGRERVEGTSYV